MHIFAISGLHIAMIAVIFMALLRAIAVPRFVCGCIVLPLIWFYTAATGWQASAVRSTVMSSVIIVGWMLRRPSDLLNSLATAALIILVFDPLHLFQASFQLSFFVVLSLALLVPLLGRVKQRIFTVDPLLPMELRPAWQRAGIQFGHWFWGFFAASLASFLGALPLTAYYFNLFTPGSLLANLIVVPMSAAALVAGLGSLVTGALFPAVAELFNHAGWFFMRGMVRVSEMAAEFPGSCFHMRSPGLLEFLLYYLLLIAGLAGWFLRPRLRWVVTPAVALLAICCAAQWQVRRGAAELTIVPTPASHLILARAANEGRHTVINCGHRSSFDLFVKPFLQAQGVNSIDELVLARGDVRHNGAMVELHGRFPVVRALAAPAKSLSKPFRDATATLAKQTQLHNCATNGFTFGAFRVLHPDVSDPFKRGQDLAVVLLGKFEGVNVLLLSDLGIAGQKTLYDRLAGVAVDILVTGMPDSGEPLAPELLDRLKPKLVVFVDTQKSPVAVLQRRVEGTGTKLLFTRDTGAVTLRMRRGSWVALPALREAGERPRSEAPPPES